MHPFLPSARGDLLAKLGRVEEARADIAKAVALTKNERQRRKLEELAEGLPRGGSVRRV